VASRSLTAGQAPLPSPTTGTAPGDSDMNRFFSTAIMPLLDILRPKDIVEIGACRGMHSELLLQHTRDRGCHLHIIDVNPTLSDALRNSENVTLYLEDSLAALSKIRSMDLVLIDGDHNYFTVLNELKLIQILSKQYGLPFIAFHDVNYPYARRDQYCQPEKIPASYKKSWEMKGTCRGIPHLLGSGGDSSSCCNAILEGGPHNGVLTAIEKFLSSLDKNFSFITIPSNNGLGLFCPERLGQNKEMKYFLLGLNNSNKTYPSDQYEYLYKPTIAKKRPHLSDDVFYKKVTIIITNLGASDFNDIALRRIRSHTPANVSIKVLHSGPHFERIQHIAGCYGVIPIRLSEAQISHQEALKKSLKLIDTDYVLFIDSDAFPIHDNWTKEFIDPLRDGCLCIGPKHNLSLENIECCKKLFNFDVKYRLHVSCLACKMDYLKTLYPLANNIFAPAYGENRQVIYDVAGLISFYAQTNGLRTHAVKINTGYYGTGTIYGDSVFHAWYNTRQAVEPNAFLDAQLRDWFDISLEELHLQQSLLVDNENAYFSGLMPDHFPNLKRGRWKSPFQTSPCAGKP
jgi:hypothetical protein